MDCEDIEYYLRYELWLNHGHGKYLYGDDGEMQCHKCPTWDYKRMPLNKLRSAVEQLRMINATS